MLQRTVGNRATAGVLAGQDHGLVLQRKGGFFSKLFGKKTYERDDYQADIRKALGKSSAARAAKALGKACAKATDAGLAWADAKPVLKTITGPQQALAHGDDKLRDAVFALASNVNQKAEVLYFLGGTAEWKRDAMGANNIGHEEFREALVRLQVFEQGSAGHKKGPEVDALIEDKLETFVEKGLEARGRITGRIAVVGGADWDVIGLKQYGQAWAQKKNTLNAFVDRGGDPPRVFVNKDRGNAGTAIHEACHMWGDPGRPINSISHDLNEGVTEYFARKVCAQLVPPIPRTVYAKQFAIAKKLADTVGEDVVGKAFFDGEVDALQKAMGDTRWANFVKHINEGKYDRAEAVLDKVKSGQSDDEEEVGSLADLFGS